MIEHMGGKVRISELARTCNISDSQLRRRYAAGLRDAELVADTDNVMVSYNGTKLTLKELGKKIGRSYSTMKRRYKEGLRGAALANSDNRNLGTLSKGVKLDHEAVIDIYYLAHAEVYTQEEIGEIYGVHQTTVSDIKTIRRWGCLLLPLVTPSTTENDYVD